MKTYVYTNSIGRKKLIDIYDDIPQNGKYPFAIWDTLTGELCNNGQATKKELEHFLAHYGVQAQF